MATFNCTHASLDDLVDWMTTNVGPLFTKSWDSAIGSDWMCRVVDYDVLGDDNEVIAVNIIWEITIDDPKRATLAMIRWA